MKRASLVAFLSLVLSLFPTAALQAGLITYDLNNYSSLQNGWTLSGTITTDGTFVDVGIVSWQFTVSNGVTSFSASSSQGYAQAVGVTATPTQLLLSAPNGFTYNQLILVGTPGLTSFLTYDRDNTGQNPEVDIYQQFDYGTPAWQNLSTGSTGLPLGGDPWVIATAEPVATPEPASMTLLLTGIGGLAGYRLVRSQLIYSPVRRQR